jgi:hypothetical protein
VETKETNLTWTADVADRLPSFAKALMALTWRFVAVIFSVFDRCLSLCSRRRARCQNEILD